MTKEDKAKFDKMQDCWDEGVFYGSQPIYMDGEYEMLTPDNRQPEKVNKD